MKYGKSTLFGFLFFFGSCSDEVKKPEKLIPKGQMIDIIFDLSVLEAVKNHDRKLLESNDIDPYTYVYKKYRVDSLQFVENNKYYASDVKEYMKMYETVVKRIQESKAAVDTVKTGNKADRLKIPVDSVKDIKKEKTRIN